MGDFTTCDVTRSSNQFLELLTSHRSCYKQSLIKARYMGILNNKQRLINWRIYLQLGYTITLIIYTTSTPLTPLTRWKHIGVPLLQCWRSIGSIPLCKLFTSSIMVAWSWQIVPQREENHCSKACNILKVGLKLFYWIFGLLGNWIHIINVTYNRMGTVKIYIGLWISKQMFLS